MREPRRSWIALAAALALGMAGSVRADEPVRSAYSYVRDVTGAVTVVSELNGSVEARANLPISVGDEIRTEDPARAEIALADGNLLDIGGGTKVRLASLYAQQGSNDEVSAIDLDDGSVVLSVLGSDDRSIPRIDTDDASVYANAGSRVRVNADPRRGTAVIVRAGSVDVRTRTGSYTVRAGNYLTVRGEEEAEVARGDFSRDRFDMWVADRLQTTYDAPRSASAQYVGEDYANDVVALDDYGSWDYSTDASSWVWRPTASLTAGWTPYSYGSWYYTPIGLTWWSAYPWGWYPFHYGSWYFDAGWSSWCWYPGYVYSPAWVYWAYTPYYVGWCPIGWYGPYSSPWWNTYYRQWTYPRSSMAFAIQGTYSTRRVDFRGWNFTGAGNLASGHGRLTVTPGARMADRLGDRIAVSSRPIVLPARGSSSVNESLRTYVREAPRVIERTSGRDAPRLEPLLARDHVLPRTTLDALAGRTVVQERGRLSGPGAMELAPRGATIVERTRGSVRLETVQREVGAPPGRTITNRGTPATDASWRTAVPVARGEGQASQIAPQDSWRAMPGRAPRSADTDNTGGGVGGSRIASPRSTDRGAGTSSRGTVRAPDASRSQSPGAPDLDASSSDAWRARPSRPESPQAGGIRSVPADRARMGPRTLNEDWRSQRNIPPARRVIEGVVPGRRMPGSETRDAYPGNQVPRSHTAPRQTLPQILAPRSFDRAPAPRQAPRPQAAPPSRSAPPPSHAAPSARPAPAPAPRSGGTGSAPARGSGRPGHH
jgi:hypothetical protein